MTTDEKRFTLQVCSVSRCLGMCAALIVATLVATPRASAQEPAEEQSLEAHLEQIAAQVAQLQETLAERDAEIAELEEGIRLAREERDAANAEVDALTTEQLRARLELREAQVRQQRLATRAERMKQVLDYLEAEGVIPLERLDESLEGVVLAVGNNVIGEISLGSDDGVQVSHLLDVFRGEQQIGQLLIRRTQPDKAVGEFLRAELWEGDTLERGDRVVARWEREEGE